MSTTLSWLQPPSRALIVGVNEYENEQISNLQGCVRDALDVATFLFADLGMPASHIRLLTSPTYRPARGNRLLARHHLKGFLGQSPTPEQERLLNSAAFAKGTLHATRANIIEGIRDFLGNVAPGEEVLFYYSGHGSTNRLKENIRFGDEKGETLVPADAGVNVAESTTSGDQPSYTETYQILDRELRYLVAELLEKGIRMTIVADSCHSGGIVRGEHDEAEEDSAPRARLTTAWHNGRDLKTLLDGQVDFTRLEALYSGIPLPYTHIAGCLATELSYEVKGKDRRYQGAMTSALLRTLREVKGAVTYRELGRALRSSVPEHANKEKQHPNITGEQERLPFSNQTIRRSSPLFAVQKVRKRWIELDGGQLEGVNQDCILICYSDWSLSTAQGEYKVIKSRANVARAEPIKSSNPVYPKIGQPLMLKTRADRPTIFFDLSAHKIAEAWREREESAGQGGGIQPAFGNFGWSNSAFGFGVSTQKQEEEEDEAWQESNSWKGVPYLIEAFSEDADYRASVEQQMLIVKQRDGSLVEALHKEIYDPESNHPTTIPFNKRHHHTADFLSFLLDRIINYQTFVAKKPGKRETLRLNVTGEEPEVKVEVQFAPIGQSTVALTTDDQFALPAGARLQINISNQTYKNKDLFVNLYYLDPELYFAERIWPSDGTEQLQANTSRNSIWQLEHWSGGLLNLKLFLSTKPLNLEQRPCGAPQWQRGASASSVRALKTSSQGWNAYDFVLGATKETNSGYNFL